MTPTLERWRREGAVAVKLACAYMRPLDFRAPEGDAAAAAYARFAPGGEAPPEEARGVQDAIFHHLAREAGRLGLPLHIHVGSGASGYFGARAAHPLQLEPTLNDPALRGSKFVLVHGGHPFAAETVALIYKPHVWADFSAQTFLLYPRKLAAVLRDWLEWVPEKVLFATDAFGVSEEVGWEESLWMSNRNARRALALALSGMLRDGEITRAQAEALAHRVLRDNALELYGATLR